MKWTPIFEWLASTLSRRTRVARLEALAVAAEALRAVELRDEHEGSTVERTRVRDILEPLTGTLGDMAMDSSAACGLALDKLGAGAWMWRSVLTGAPAVPSPPAPVLHVYASDSLAVTDSLVSVTLSGSLPGFGAPSSGSPSSSGSPLSGTPGGSGHGTTGFWNPWSKTPTAIENVRSGFPDARRAGRNVWWRHRLAPTGDGCVRVGAYVFEDDGAGVTETSILPPVGVSSFCEVRDARLYNAALARSFLDVNAPSPSQGRSWKVDAPDAPAT